MTHYRYLIRDIYLSKRLFHQREREGTRIKHENQKTRCRNTKFCTFNKHQRMHSDDTEHFSNYHYVLFFLTVWEPLITDFDL